MAPEKAHSLGERRLFLPAVVHQIELLGRMTHAQKSNFPTHLSPLLTLVAAIVLPCILTGSEKKTPTDVQGIPQNQTKLVCFEHAELLLSAGTCRQSHQPKRDRQRHEPDVRLDIR